MDRVEAEVRNEAALRDRNEWILHANESFAGDAGTHLFVCECGDPACEEFVRLTVVEYEAVREHATRFVIAVDHENPEVEYVVSEQGRRFAVVAKIGASSRRIVGRSDPRRLDRANAEKQDP